MYLFKKCEIFRSLFEEGNGPSNVKDMVEIKANFWSRYPREIEDGIKSSGRGLA